MDRLIVREIAPGEWLYEIDCPADDKFPDESYEARVSGSATDARNAAVERMKARLWERHSERKAAAGAEGGSKKKQPVAVARAWAKRTRELMDKKVALPEAAQKAAGETGFKPPKNYRSMSNRLCAIEREAAVKPVTDLEQAHRDRANMDALKRRRDEWLSTQR